MFWPRRRESADKEATRVRDLGGLLDFFETCSIFLHALLILETLAHSRRIGSIGAKNTVISRDTVPYVADFVVHKKLWNILSGRERTVLNCLSLLPFWICG